MSSEDEPLFLSDEPIRTDLQVSGVYVVMWQQFVESVPDISSYLGSTQGICRAYQDEHFEYWTFKPLSFIGSTHGRILKEAPSELEDFMRQNNDPIEAHDFIELEYSIEVYPMRISIMERYDPGTVIRVWAWDKVTKYWQKLWSGPPQSRQQFKVAHNHRLFTPPLAVCKFKTRTIRLELNHSLTNYYTQFAAVLLFGTEELIVPNNGMINAIPLSIDFYKDPEWRTDSESDSYSNSDSNSDLDSSSDSQYHVNDIHNLSPYGPYIKRIDYDIRNFKAFICKSYLTYARNLDLEERSLDLSRDNDKIANGSFNKLSYDMVLKILEYLDFKTLVRCSQLNKRFNAITRDSKLYRSLNLKPYWNYVNDTTLRYLQERCTHLERIDLSWSCDTKISSKVFIHFLCNRGGKLTHLRLNNCNFVDRNVIIEISMNCPHLKELCLRNCIQPMNGEFQALENLKCLERLELYNTNACSTDLIRIIRNNVNLRHLDVGRWRLRSGYFNLVATAIPESCPNFETLNFVYNQRIHPSVIGNLSHCRNLRELDIGWCDIYNYETLAELFRNCHNLEKVFAARVKLEDTILEPLLHCKKMKQLDISGSLVSPLLVNRMFEAWPDLRFIDFSSCFHRCHKPDVRYYLHQWTKHYQNLTMIRHSFNL